jgi:hypothetical protein
LRVETLMSGTSQPVAKPGIRASAENVAHSARLADAAGQGTPAGKAELSHPSFFKTPAGMIVLGIVAAGTGYAIYSASHDRIHSVTRANQ